MSKRGSIACTNPNEQSETPFLQLANLILPWPTPQELASLSTTSTTLHHLSATIFAARSGDASRSLEPLPIPFINTIDTQPYAYFLYSSTQILPSSLPRRQIWGPNPNPNPSMQLGLGQFGLVSDAVGCDCGGKCVGVDEESSDCPCLVLRCGEVMTECGSGCGCRSGCGNRASQKGVTTRLEILRVVNKGWGLFAAQFIRSGEFVCEYTGELLTTKEARRRQQVYDELSRNSQFSSALLVVREHLPSKSVFLDH